MTDKLLPLIAGNWKMNGLTAALGEIRAIVAAAGAGEGLPEILICPPATLLKAAAEICKGSAVRLGGQDCSGETRGPHTGDI